MKKILLFFLVLFPTLCLAQKKKSWVKDYWVSTNLSLLHSIEKRGAGISFDAGRNLKYGIKIGAGYTFLQFDLITKIDVINAYLEKGIDGKNNALFFFAKPGIAIPKKAKQIAVKYSPYEYEDKKNGLNLLLGSGIRWKVKRHSFFLSAGYNITKYSFTAKESVLAVNPYNPFVENPIIHIYKLSNNNVIVNIGFTL
jgi:hypothetical protein